MNDSQLLENPSSIDTDNPDDVHHHCKRDGFVDPDEELVALCGAKRKPLPNPLAYECCPECAKRMSKPCISVTIYN